MSVARFLIFNATGIFCLLLSVSARAADPAVSNAPPETAAMPGSAAPSEEDVAPEAGVASASTNQSDETLRAYLQLQEQLHQTLLTIEQGRQEAADAAAKNAKALANRMQLIEENLATQRDSAQRLNHTLVIVVSAFATLGCVAVLLSAYLQWHTVHRLTTVLPALSLGRGLAPFPALADSGGGENRQLMDAGSAQRADSRLLGAIERLEKRIRELERSPNPLPDQPAAPNIVDFKSGNGDQSVVSSEGPQSGDSAAAELLVQGQSLLHEGKLEEAVACFDQVLAADPQHGEALVKKGAALERLRKPQEALECYDRAIAANSSMAIAYLYKGGLYNRLERFSEALECYEKALRSQQGSRAS